MDAAPPVEEVSDPYWSSPEDIPSLPSANNMSRSSSEWAIQRFLEEIWKSEQDDDDDVVEIEKPNHHHHRPFQSDPSTMMSQFGCGGGDDDHRVLLKRRLDLACAAAAARTRESSVLSQESASFRGVQSQILMGSQLASPVTGPWNAIPTQQVEDLEGDYKPFTFPEIPDPAKKSGAQIMHANSGSSRDQSDDDELEGETETTENMEPTNEKRVRRKQSNRESAKRSRRRKQEHLSELETQAARLRLEKSSLLKLLNEWDRKYSEAAVDNRVLKADIETLRAKVMMVENKVKRVTGVNASPLFSLPDMHNVATSFGINRPVTAASSLHHDLTRLTSQQAHYQTSSPGFPANSSTSRSGTL